MFLQKPSLDLFGLLDGITASLIVIFSVVFAVIVYYKAIKMDASLLKNGALMMSFAGLLWLGPTCEFFSIWLFGHHLNPVELYGILSYMWVAPALVLAMYIGAELMLPDQKKIVLIIYSILGVIFELFLFLDTTNSFEFTLSGGLVDAKFVYGHPTFILIAIFLISVFILNGIGAIRNAFAAKGEIRIKFISMALAFVLFVVVGTFDALLTPGPLLYIMRMGMIACAFLLYKALKP